MPSQNAKKILYCQLFDYAAFESNQIQITSEWKIMLFSFYNTTPTMLPSKTITLSVMFNI